MSQLIPSWPHPRWPNENIFLIPKQLSHDDEIIISGNARNNPTSISMSLITGHQDRDYQNIACQIEANFITNQIQIGIVKDGVSEVINGDYQYYSANDVLLDSNFHISVRCIVNNLGSILSLSIHNSHLQEILLKHDYSSLRFIAMEGDVECVKALKFLFGSSINNMYNNEIWPQSQEATEKIFLVPKRLNMDDSIVISGIMNSNPRSLFVSLVTGHDHIDYQNVALQLEVNFQENDVQAKTIQNGATEIIPGIYLTAGELLTNLNFNFEFTFRKTRGFGDKILDISSHGVPLHEIRINQEFNEIRYIAIDGDIEQVKTLDFLFSFTS